MLLGQEGVVSLEARRIASLAHGFFSMMDTLIIDWGEGEPVLGDPKDKLPAIESFLDASAISDENKGKIVKIVLSLSKNVYDDDGDPYERIDSVKSDVYEVLAGKQIREQIMDELLEILDEMERMLSGADLGPQSIDSCLARMREATSYLAHEGDNLQGAVRSVVSSIETSYKFGDNIAGVPGFEGQFKPGRPNINRAKDQIVSLMGGGS